jgi:hypothetical protein
MCRSLVDNNTGARFHETETRGANTNPPLGARALVDQDVFTILETCPRKEGPSTNGVSQEPAATRPNVGQEPSATKTRTVIVEGPARVRDSPDSRNLSLSRRSLVKGGHIGSL